MVSYSRQTVSEWSVSKCRCIFWQLQVLQGCEQKQFYGGALLFKPSKTLGFKPQLMSRTMWYLICGNLKCLYGHTVLLGQLEVKNYRCLQCLEVSTEGWTLAGRKTDICLVHEAETASTVREMMSLLVGKSEGEKDVPVEAIFFYCFAYLHACCIRMHYGILYIRPCASDLIMACIK